MISYAKAENIQFPFLPIEDLLVETSGVHEKLQNNEKASPLTDKKAVNCYTAPQSHICCFSAI